MAEQSTASDGLRQLVNLILVVTTILCSNIESVFGVGRSIAEQSDANDTLLVPWGPAFSIWLPIFAGLIAYAVVQALPGNRARAIYRRTGWWSGLSFAALTLWGLAASLLDGDLSRWSTALLFWPIVAGAVVASLRFGVARAELGAVETLLTYGPLSLLAGWVSLAMFLNWAQVGTYTWFGFGLTPLMIAVLTLAAALGFAVTMMILLRGNKPFAFSVVWGLGFLAYARLAVDDLNPLIGGLAAAGAVVIAVCAVAAGRRRAVVS